MNRLVLVVKWQASKSSAGLLRTGPSSEKGTNLVRTVTRWSGSVVTWPRVQTVLLSAVHMDWPGSPRCLRQP
jgi:hypothetical protein